MQNETPSFSNKYIMLLLFGIITDLRTRLSLLSTVLLLPCNHNHTGSGRAGAERPQAEQGSVTGVQRQRASVAAGHRQN